MSNVTQVLANLQDERKRMQLEIRGLDQAIGVLKRLVGRSQAGAMAPKRRLSLAARRRIAAAQRLRWAKVRQQKKAA